MALIDAKPETAAILVIFVVTYCGIAAGHVPGLRLNRTGIALLGAIAIMVFTRLPTTTLIGFIDSPTILLLFGFFVLSAQLQLSGFFDQVATELSSRFDNPRRFLLTLMLVTAGLSAFLNHDIVCFVFTPVVASALLRKRLNPVPFLVAVAIASNIGAAATPVGNPQNMVIAQTAGLHFGRYMAWCAVPVVASLAAAYALIWMMSRHHLTSMARVSDDAEIPLRPFNRGHTIKGLIILTLVIALFFSRIPKEIIALTAAGVHLASRKFHTDELLALVDWPVLVLFMSLFVVTGAFQSTGYGDQALHWLGRVGVDLHSPPTLSVVTAALSNLIGNSAAVLLLVKVVNVDHPGVAYALALANSIGGSLVVIGSVSNIIVLQRADDLKIEISFRDYARLGVPVTLVSLGVVLVWTSLMA